MSAEPAARVGDPFGHSSALSGALIGLAVGAAVGIAIVATGGLGAIAIGAAIGLTGGVGMIGQSIAATIMGPPTGAIAIGSPNVFTNARPQAAAVIATGPCAKESGTPVPEATGAATVLINGMPAGRVSETMVCSAKILSGSPNVLIGGASVQVLPITPEVPAWLSTTMQVMAIGGTLIATGGIAATYGVGTAVGSLVGGVVFGELGAHGGGWLADQMGIGATGRAIMTATGGLIGSMVGGGAGFKGGRSFDSRYVVSTEGLGSNFGNVRIMPRASSQQSPFQTRIDPNHPGRPDPKWSVDTRNFDPNAPGVTRTKTGAIRDQRQFWKEWSQRNPETLSRTNRYRIDELGLAPKVDNTWIKSFPEHAGYRRQGLEHHHINHGDIAIPLPRDVHRGPGNYGIWHGGP